LYLFQSELGKDGLFSDGFSIFKEWKQVAPVTFSFIKKKTKHEY